MVLYVLYTHAALQTVTNDAVLVWARRAISDFDKKIGKNATTKQKARLVF